jgi:antitoxin component YwqK of YwqJK toxin-antitoxin module
MEFKIFSRNYCLKLPKLLQFSFFVTVLILSSCTEEKPTIIDSKISSAEEVDKVPVTFYENGRPKGFNLFGELEGEKVLIGYEEVHENGALKINGALNTKGQRTGHWESFYEDGSLWSIGDYNKDVETGIKKTWYPNGSLRYEGEMKNGKPSGTWSFWSQDGVKTQKEYN